jgi:CelD/BcsL family acetyltransferase involved in cellulose biosynthesis
MFRVETVCSPEELRGDAHAWNALLAETPGATFFRTLDWLEAYWRRAGDDERIFVQKIYEGRSPIGFLPLTIRRESSRAGTLRTLTYPLHDWGTFYGPIGPRPGVCLRYGLAAAREMAWSDSRMTFDLVELRWIDHERGDDDRVAQAMELAGLPSVAATWNEAFLLRSPGPVGESSAGEAWHASLPRKFRAHLRRMEKRADEAGGFRRVTWRPRGSAYGDDDPRLDLYDDCLAVAERSWQADPERGVTLCTPATAPFLRDVHIAAARAGAVQIDLVYLRDQPIAFAYGYTWNGSYFGLRNGFDPDFSEYAPGAVATVQALERALDAGDVTIDLGPGSGGYKRTLGGLPCPIGCRTHFPPYSLKAQLLRAKRWLRPSALGRYDDARPKDDEVVQPAENDAAPSAAADAVESPKLVDA